VFFIIQIIVFAFSLFGNFYYTYLASWSATLAYGFFVLGISFYMIRSENRKIAILSILAWIPLMFSALWLYAGYLNSVALNQNNSYILNAAAAIEQILFLMLAIFWWKNLSNEYTNLDHRFKIMQVKSMDQKMNPHFLYNSLNMILGMLQEDKKQAEETVVELADIYEYMTYHVERDLVPLKEEWQFALRYFTIMNKRSNGFAKIKTQLSKNAQMFSIPPLTIQTILENCLKHGRPKTISPKDSFLIIMKAQIEQNTLTISISDNGSGFDDKQKSSGAIQNIKQRLEHYYSRVQVIRENQQKGGTRITIIISENK
jgi:sensor histidine kinase YesM